MRFTNKTRFIIILYISIFNVRATIHNRNGSNNNGAQIHSKVLIYQDDSCTEITQNDIKSIPADLETIIFVATGLSEIPEELFKKIPNVQNVIFRCNRRLKKIPESFYDLKKVKRLDISEAYIYHSLPPNFRSLEELTFSNHLYPAFEGLVPSLAEYTKLKRLDISKNKFKSIPPIVFTCPQIEILNLSGNSLVKIPQEILGMTSLTNLNLSNNNLNSLDNIGIELLQQLESLDLSKNSLNCKFLTSAYQYILKKINPTKKNLLSPNENDYHLKYLDISQNTTILSPNVFEGFAHVFKNLQTLKMNDSKIKQLPKFIYSLEHLKNLDIRNNAFAEEDIKIEKLKNLKLALLQY